MDPRETISDYERERGKPTPSKLHSIAQKKLIIALHEFEPPYTVFSERTLQLDDREVTPDLSIYEAQEIDFWHDEVRLEKPPLMTIEIASPTQGIQPLIDKVHFLADHGVQSYWLVQPQLRTIPNSARLLSTAMTCGPRHIPRGPSPTPTSIWR
ncbi:MAG: hypothetical protein BRD42_00180 [Bacteroidetes bacterium QS_3_64_15]|nr:MAG: hypothetical protein BRD42_00180 [Bacteroidetes bacterium QS_3_64_15]